MKNVINKLNRLILLIGILILCLRCDGKKEFVSENADTITVQLKNAEMLIHKKGFRYGFKKTNGTWIAPIHAISGLQIKKSDETHIDVIDTKLLTATDDQLELEASFSNGLKTTVTINVLANAVKLSVTPQEVNTYEITLRTGGMGPAYGMGDQAAYDSEAAFGSGGDDVMLRDFVRDPFDPPIHGPVRMISNFAIFPQEGLAMVNIEPRGKLVRITNEETAQGSKNVEQMPSFYYFFGSSEEIYKAFLTVRNTEGYPVLKPKYEWFGIGWEAFGALGWNTNHKTVTENINQYLDYGYPLDWMVVGSGFWPSGVGEFDEHGSPYSSSTKSEKFKKLQATTTFGMWSKTKYPDPKGFIDYFHKKGLVFTIGLRIAFIPGGPFTDEGLQNGYFIKGDNDKAALFEPGFPIVPVHLLDTQNKQAVAWYVQLCDKWLSFGVDGFKEDLFGHKGAFRDDLINPINEALMDKGVYIMGRNSYLASVTDIHRYDDFNYNHPQDRGPINGLAFAYSGFPYVYADIVGGTGLATDRWGSQSKEKLRLYLVRYAQYAALNSSLSFGHGPWNYDEEVNQLCLKAAKLHDRLHPYIYSNAIRVYHTGYPYTVTPLPLAYPQDKNVYGLANTTRRSYEWLIGDALLAAPLYGDDYNTATSRDIYLPEGKWIDYDTGEAYQGPKTLENFDIPLDKAPLFVGGTGIVIEEVEGQLKARIYPISQNAETIFYGKDGETKSTIKIDNPNWNANKIIDETTNKEVSYKEIRHALEFDFIAGHNYLIN